MCACRSEVNEQSMGQKILKVSAKVDIAEAVYHLVIFMQSNKIHEVPFNEKASFSTHASRYFVTAGRVE